MSDQLQELRDSVRHLGDVASSIDPPNYTAPAYPKDWTVAETFSHLGSGAVIGRRSFEDALAHRESDPASNTAVWDEWNAKGPTAQVVDCLASELDYLSSLEAATEDQREDFHFTMGPFEFDFDGLVGLRLSEHVLHTWDVEVAFAPSATLSSDAANAILDRIQFIVSRTGKSTGAPREVTIRTTDSGREFTLVLDVDSVDLVESRHEGAVDLTISAEALVRLIYGRLDQEHTPVSVTGEVVNLLRLVFPGF